MIELAHLLTIDDIEAGQGANQIRSMKHPGETRWGSHLGSISNLMDLFNHVCVVLQNLVVDFVCVVLQNFGCRFHSWYTPCRWRYRFQLYDNF
jgi:hypothetical protein